ncbi:hypothetical protein K1719_045893 [Acacia pycnantha]|nr:hypothetical protein K1719_045893 [Acacia pycnantha]
MTSQDSQVYHETQRLQFCLLHCLNNLFQDGDAFTQAGLNAISKKLTLEDPERAGWTPLSIVFKPHHNVLTGNYDVNVLIAALGERGKSVVWHDHRNGASSIDLNSPDATLMGIVLNVPVKRIFGFWKSRHWVALRRIDGIWYNLDSDLASPEPFKDADELWGYLDSVIAHGGEVLLVMNEKQS